MQQIPHTPLVGGKSKAGAGPETPYLPSMTQPTVVTIPHSLGRDEARRRLKARAGELPSHIPGGVAEFSTTWPSEDRMDLQIVAMMQRLSATLDVQDKAVVVKMILRPFLGMMSGLIAWAVREQGGKLLLGDGSKTKA